MTSSPRKILHSVQNLEPFASLITGYHGKNLSLKRPGRVRAASIKDRSSSLFHHPTPVRRYHTGCRCVIRCVLVREVNRRICPSLPALRSSHHPACYNTPKVPAITRLEWPRVPAITRLE